ncbi:hypothetical protein VRU48_17170 [Pedobacter sp. KR3-3]|uniref:DUF4382 domain-containing protein n=1 Tax=Pedobacter albus TaxID=3113905 RepID=A0ABU7IBK4_9SPHI|nr:hypothetical protein [Pedobacter sp. KR3-3]MEE1946860.1 hypothetical protein [Pedobacter sp. KR3-3]
MKKLAFLAVVLWTALLASSCNKENTTAKANLSYSFGVSNLYASLGTTAATSGTPVAQGTNGSINWTSMSLNIAKIVFNASHAGSNVAFESKNFNAVNPLQAGILSGTVSIPAGVYENIKFNLTLTENATVPIFTLNGTYIEASGTQIPVSVQFTQSQLLNYEAKRVEVVAGDYVANVSIKINMLVTGLTRNDFGQTTRTGNNNAIVVNSTTNKALYDKLMANLASTISFDVAKK